MTSTTAPKALYDLSLSTILSTVIATVSVRFMFNGGEPWMILQDLIKLLGYSTPRTSNLRQIFDTHGRNMAEFVVGLPLGRRGLMLINEAGLCVVCDLVKPERTQELKLWLKNGGIQHIADKARALKPQPQTDNSTNHHLGFPTDRPIHAGRVLASMACPPQTDLPHQFKQTHTDHGAPAIPPGTAPLIGDVPGNVGDPADPIKDLPLVQNWRTEEFDGTQLRLARYCGLYWLIDEEVAALLGSFRREIDYILDFIDSAQVFAQPQLGAIIRTGIADGSARRRVSLLNLLAVDHLCQALATPRAQALAEWFRGIADEDGGGNATIPLDECRRKLSGLYIRYDLMTGRILAQARGMRAALESAWGEISRDDIGEMLEMVLDQARPFDELQNAFDQAMIDLGRSIKAADDGERMPEWVWLELVKSLALSGLDDETNWRLGKVATQLNRFAGGSPAVAAAMDHLRELIEGHGGSLVIRDVSAEECPSPGFCLEGEQ